MRITLKRGAINEIQGALDVSRDELARRMRVSTSTAWRIENGIVDPSPKFIAGLMHVSGKPFESLFEIVSEAA